MDILTQEARAGSRGSIISKQYHGCNMDILTQEARAGSRTRRVWHRRHRNRREILEMFGRLLMCRAEYNSEQKLERL